uniref:Ubiquitin-like protease family profile domain-containing protein n=1 Tax=Oryza barthii TaxID=65489 RepID=A0A0D3GEW4_9ORYZ
MGELLLFPPVAPASVESAEPTAEARSRRFPLIAPAVAVGSVGCGGGMGKRKTIVQKGMLGKPEPSKKTRGVSQRAKKRSIGDDHADDTEQPPPKRSRSKRLIEGAGFHGLVDLKCSKLRPDLCSWLMEHFNPATNQLVFPGCGAIDVNEESVKSVLGIPMGDKDVSYEMESEATEFVLNLLGINDGISPSLTSLGIQLEKLKLADDKYLRMWIIYAISSVLAPTTATTVSPRCYPSVVDAGNIKNLNWCKFVISILQKAAKAGKNTNSACLLYMMILYLDSLSFKNLNVPVEGYRATVWTNELINQTILADTSADGSFGALPENDRIVIAVQNVTSSDDEDFVADEEEVEDTEEDEYTDEDGDSDDDEDEGEEDDDDEGEEDDDEDRSENDDNDGAETGRSGEQADAATNVIGCKGDDTNEGIGSGGKDVDDVTGCKGDDTNEGIGSGGKGADDVIGKGKQVDEGIGFGDKEKHEEKQAPNAVAQNVPESEKQPVQKAEKYPFLTTTIDSHEVPNFNLGFDSSQEVVQTPKGQEAAGTSRGKEFTGIITNEDYGSFTTEDYEKEPIACEVEEETPVPHEYNKRVVKPAKFKRSPFIDYENKKQFVVSRVINEVYDDICKNGGRTKLRRNSRKIIDTGEYYIYLGDLANSVKPMGSLDNNICELALIVLSADIKDNSKRIFPARIGGYLLDSQLDRNELKKHFDQTRANRLDHKELAFFPILQKLGNGNDKAGHYFMVCLNLKAERFEVYDSLRGEDDEELISASHLVVASIKTMWDRVYMRSSKKTIQNYPLIFIDGPKQDNIQTYPCFVFANKNSRDCGFYMLKFVELWDGKQLPAFEPSDIPNIKKLLTHKMLSFQENRVQWMQVLWGKQPDPTLKVK